MTQLRVHLVTGEVLESRPPEPGELDGVDLDAFKEELKGILASSEGWQLDLIRPDGSWVVVPKHSVVYVEMSQGEEA